MILWQETSSDSATLPRARRNLEVKRGQCAEQDTRPIRVRVFLTKAVGYDNTQYSSRRLQNSSVFLYLLVTMLTCLPIVASAETCSRKIALHTFRYRNCVPTRRIAPVCLGSCRSYSMTNRDKPFVTQNSCTCCQAVQLITAGLSFKCPVLNDKQRRFYQVMVQVRIPKTCMCRPCIFEPPVKSHEEETDSEVSGNETLKLLFKSPKTLLDLFRQELPLASSEDTSSKQPPIAITGSMSAMESPLEVKGKTSSKQAPTLVNENASPQSVLEETNELKYQKELAHTSKASKPHIIIAQQIENASLKEQQVAGIEVTSPKSLPVADNKITSPKPLEVENSEDLSPKKLPKLDDEISSFDPLPVLVNKDTSPNPMPLVANKASPLKEVPAIFLEDSFVREPLGVIRRDPFSKLVLSMSNAHAQFPNSKKHNQPKKRHFETETNLIDRF